MFKNYVTFYFLFHFNLCAYEAPTIGADQNGNLVKSISRCDGASFARPAVLLMRESGFLNEDNAMDVKKERFVRRKSIQNKEKKLQKESEKSERISHLHSMLSSFAALTFVVALACCGQSAALKLDYFVMTPANNSWIVSGSQILTLSFNQAIMQVRRRSNFLHIFKKKVIDLFDTRAMRQRILRSTQSTRAARQRRFSAPAFNHSPRRQLRTATAKCGWRCQARRF